MGARRETKKAPANGGPPGEGGRPIGARTRTSRRASPGTPTRDARARTHRFKARLKPCFINGLRLFGSWCIVFGLSFFKTPRIFFFFFLGGWWTFGNWSMCSSGGIRTIFLIFVLFWFFYGANPELELCFVNGLQIFYFYCFVFFF